MRAWDCPIHGLGPKPHRALALCRASAFGLEPCRHPLLLAPAPRSRRVHLHPRRRQRRRPLRPPRRSRAPELLPRRLHHRPLPGLRLRRHRLHLPRRLPRLPLPYRRRRLNRRVRPALGMRSTTTIGVACPPPRRTCSFGSRRSPCVACPPPTPLAPVWHVRLQGGHGG
jgi:hypothetical protein